MLKNLIERLRPKSHEISLSGSTKFSNRPGETILDAGLRQKIALRHQCRVGGCAECKCKLINGKVKELTESSYILSADELANGYILACQSIPKTDIEINANVLDAIEAKNDVGIVRGAVSAKTNLTHDIVKVDVELSGRLHYTSGQYAMVRVPGVIDKSRAYSFASANSSAQANSTISFFIRAIDGGEMSNYMQQEAIVGQPLEIEGPYGDFWLRQETSPILCIAGGSGIAPLKSMLEEATIQKVDRPVRFLFGARTQADLYCIDAFRSLAKEWPNTFDFTPVLSDESLDSNWQGRRGLVTDFIAEKATENTSVYLCGPPAMVDSAEEALTKYGVSSYQIHFDKFLDQRHTTHH